MPGVEQIDIIAGADRNVKESISQNLLIKREHLISSFLDKREQAFTDKLSLLIDDYFRESYENSQVGLALGMIKNPYAIVALGGYGRREQCIGSDIDILFLFKDSVPREAEALIQEIVYPLWDAGFDVGHSTRSVKECIRMAGDDIETLMAILDGRFICGMSNLFVQVMEHLRRKVIRSRSGKIISLIVEDINGRHDRFGDASYLLEPNLKEGKGGLRDYHTMLWIARVKSDLRQPRDLEYLGYVSEKEFEALEDSVSYLHAVRNRLHHLAGRKCDQLYMEYQKEIADVITIVKKDGKQPVELFLGELHGHMACIKQQHQVFLSEMGFLKLQKKGRGILGKRSGVSGIIVTKRNMLDFVSLEAVLKNPELMIRIFEESLRLSIPISAPAKRVIKELDYLISGQFRNDPSIVNIFEKILLTVSSDYNVLNEMMNTGFLTQFIPELKGIQNLIQYNSYHIYPVDKHSLKTVETAKKLGMKANGHALFHELYHELEDRRILLWACLLHDIGKSLPSKNHAESGMIQARNILERFAYPKAFVATVSFLVGEHLYLIKTATRRDIQDEETVISVARRISNIDQLKMLYMLTVADAMATGEKAWNDWTASLVRDLFLKVLKILKTGELATPEATEIIARKKNELLSLRGINASGPEFSDSFEVMTPRYLLYVEAKDINAHIGLYSKLGDKPFVLDVEKDESSNTRIVTICAKNRNGLFSMIAGGFTLNSLDILDAQVFTWRNGIAIDVFHVTPPKDKIFEDENWQKTENRLLDILSDKINLAEKLKDRILKGKEEKRHTSKRPLRVNVDNDSSSFYTIIEVFAYDYPGLLFSVTHELFKHGIDIHMAKIATKIDQVVDIFYVRNFSGDKIESREETDRIKSDILNILETK
ncbi:MAG: [protein-PII] uridylyltransferase [Proteobacteria bacterium]|nr:[protein-PII] uridylyltransferase [Pseudomonadota bacterium]